jgi:hypothetical protein
MLNENGTETMCMNCSFRYSKKKGFDTTERLTLTNSQ